MTDEARPSQRMPRTPWRRRLLRWEVFLALVVAADFALNVQLSPYFLSTETLSDVSFNFTEKALVALPMTLLIIAGEIDISVAATMALVSVCMGLLATTTASLSAIVGCGLAVGLLAGALNGALVTRWRVPAIVATIGTMSLYRGIAYGILGVAALIDLVVYGRLKDVTVCYRCHSEFRGAFHRSAPPFDLHTADVLEQEYERRIGRR